MSREVTVPLRPSPAVWFGSAYYAEYQPYDRLDQDVQLMRDAGFNLVRVGESTWGDQEPADGQFEFGPLERVIDAMHRADIRVLLGTPTYAIPAWLHRAHPELMAQRVDGSRVPYGGRQNVNITDPTYLRYAERIVRESVGHFANHPAVVGYQVDNEIGVETLHNANVVTAFRDWLRAKYSVVEAVNERWGLAHWSLRLHSWDDLWAPAGNTNPGYALEWRRFQSKITADFIGWQRRLVQEYARPDQFVTHCLVGGLGVIRPCADAKLIADEVDVVAVNPYHPTQSALLLPVQPLAAAQTPEWMAGDGVWSVYLQGDVAYGLKHAPFLVSEFNAITVGFPHQNQPAYDGQWRQAALAMVCRGAAGISYWHFHSLHYGRETYWQGILGHDLEPGRCYREIAALGNELRSSAEVLRDLAPSAEVAFLHSRDSDYALTFQPRLARSDGSPEVATYARVFGAFYRGFFEAGAQARVVFAADDWSAFPVLVVPALQVADDDLLRRLEAYAAAGGHLVLTLACGFADEFSRVRWSRAPGPLRPAAGMSYQEFSNLGHPVGVLSALGDFVVSNGARATAWADGVQPENVDTEVRFAEDHFAQFCAVTSRACGAGRVTWVSTVPNDVLARDIAVWSLSKAGVRLTWPELPEAVRATSARNAGGNLVWFLANWSAEAQFIASVVTGRGGNKPIGVGDVIRLAPFDLMLIEVSDEG